jgi:hypothetical protein
MIYALINGQTEIANRFFKIHSNGQKQQITVRRRPYGYLKLTKRDNKVILIEDVEAEF